MGQKLDKAPSGAYDAIVYIEGSEVVAEDSNGRKIASGEAGVDDSTTLQATASLGGRILITSNLYISSSTAISRSNTLVFSRNYSILTRASSLLSPTINILGTAGAANWITDNVPPGGRKIHVGVITGLAIGDVICIRELATELYSTNRIVSIDVPNKEITLEMPLVYGTQVAAPNSFVKLLNCPTNVQIAGLRFAETRIAKVANGLPHIQVDYATKTKISNLVFDKTFGHSVIAINGSYIFDLDGIRIDGCEDNTGTGGGLGYGINIGAGSRLGNISNSHIFRTRHAVTGDQAYNLNYSNVHASGDNENPSNAFDTHENMRFINYLNCTASNCSGGINIRGSFINVENFVSDSIDSGAILIDNSCIGNVNINNFVARNTINYSNAHTIYGVLYLLAAAGNGPINLSNINIGQDVLPMNPFYRAVRIGADNINMKNFHINAIANSFPVGIGELEAHNRFVFDGGKISGCATNAFSLANITGVQISNADISTDIGGAKFVLASDAIVENCPGYATKSFGSSTGTGSEQTIAHGLDAIPVGCKAWIKYLVGARYITEMIPFDATNIYPTVALGTAYEWRIE